ncbi:MAG: MFS transporter [Sphingopyxis sp.]
MHIPDFLVAGIFSLSALTWAISAPFWVSRIERKGPNPYIRAGLVGFIVSMGGCALSVELGLLGLLTPFAAFLLISILRSTYGLLGSAAATATQALIAAQTTGAARTRAITTLAGSLSLGTIVGPAIAPALIVDPFGPLGPMLGFALLGSFALAGAFVCLPRDRRGAESVLGGAPNMSLAQVWRRKEVGHHLSFGLLLCSAQAINLYTIGFVIIDRMAGDPMAAQRMIGIAMTAAAVAALLGQWGFVRLFSPSPLAMMRIGTGFAFAGNSLAVFDGDVRTAVAGFILASFGYGLARPGFSAAASLAGSTGDQVAIASAITFIAGASITLPPVIASAAYQWWRPAPFAIAAAIGAALLLSHLLPALVRHIVHDER